jgi:4-hydroxy-tetrahydrodipicolinate synthase
MMRRTVAMNYRKRDAKAYSREHMKGIWAAAINPFHADLSIDEYGFRRNLQHWRDDLGIDGVFVGGKQGEFYAMSVAERKRLFDIAVDEAKGRWGTIMSCSDQNLDVVIDLAKHAQAIGADYIVVHAPVLHFTSAQDETLYAYYEYISRQVDIGIALWSHPDSGYLMSPELCARIADIPNVVAIKYSVPREMYVKLTHLAGDKILISTASETEWFDNIVELGWKLYLCSNPPFLFQTKTDRRMREYTDLALRGEIARAARPCQILAGSARPSGRSGAPADARPYRGREGRRARGFRVLRIGRRNEGTDFAGRVSQHGERVSEDHDHAASRQFQRLQLPEMDRGQPAPAQAAGRQQAGVREDRHGGAGRGRPQPAGRLP